MIRRASLFVFTSCFLSVFTAKASVLYSISDLGPVTAVKAINNEGEVLADNFLYSNGQRQAIPQPSGGVFVPQALNDLGVVAGYVNFSGGLNYYLATYSGGLLSVHSDLGGLAPSAINDAGQIAGDLVFSYQMFLYSSGSVTPIGALPGFGESSTRGLNAAGDVIGVAIAANGNRQGFLYSSGNMQPIAPPAGVSSEVSAINNNGQIAGEYYLSPGILLDRLFLYDHGESRDLGLAFNLPAEEDYASAINDQGIIVGGAETTLGGIAWVYFPDSGFSNLNDDIPANTGWSLQTASDVNASGQIAGEGLLNGHREGFLLTPVPEPATWASIVVGLLLGLVYLGLKTPLEPL